MLLAAFLLGTGNVALPWLIGGSLAIDLAGLGLITQSDNLYKKISIDSRDDTAMAIAELQRLSSRLTTLAAEVADRIDARHLALHELEEESDQFKQLASVNRKEAEAISKVVVRRDAQRDRKSLIVSVILTVFGAVLGIVLTVIAQKLFPGLFP